MGVSILEIEFGMREAEELLDPAVLLAPASTHDRWLETQFRAEARQEAFEDISLDRRSLLETEGPPPLSLEEEAAHLYQVLLRKQAQRETLLLRRELAAGETFWGRLKWLLFGDRAERLDE